MSLPFALLRRFALGLAFLSSIPAGSAEPPAVQMRWDVKIPMRDGIKLSATLHLPKNQPAPAPCIFSLHPYTGDLIHDDAMSLAGSGYPFASVDTRGRGNSEGVFRPFIHDAQDGYDVVEWLARQPYCNGKVAMWGGSYLGYTQWVTAKEFPPHLATIVPTAAPYMGVDFPMRNNIVYPYAMRWLTLTRGHALQHRTFSNHPFWLEVYRGWHDSGRPLRELDGMAGNPSGIFQEWLSHPEPDEYWDARNPTADQYARLQIPILTITGSYDADQPGALEHYKQYMLHASPEGRARHYLVIGPWDHAGTGTPKAEFRGLKVAPAGVVDTLKLHREWYAWTMQSGPKPEFLQKNVAYYVMGAERWRYADTLEGVTARHQPLFLDSGGSATDVYSAGSMSTGQGKGKPDTYVYDPRAKQSPELDALVNNPDDLLTDQSLALALQGRQLVYHSAPMAEDTELSGFFKLSAWISIDTPDTDLYATLYEIGTDGSSLRLTMDLMRARYRNGPRKPELIRTREPLRYDFDRFMFVSKQIKQGHRLRLVVAPLGRIIDDTPFVEKNYNGGGVVAEESAADGRPVTVKLFHDRAHPSALYIPIGQPD